MYYIGLDVHKKTISYCVKDVSGQIHRQAQIGATRRELDGWMKTLPQPWVSRDRYTRDVSGRYRVCDLPVTGKGCNQCITGVIELNSPLRLNRVRRTQTHSTIIGSRLLLCPQHPPTSGHPIYRVERTSSRAGVAPAEVQRLSPLTVTPTTTCCPDCRPIVEERGPRRPGAALPTNN
jgi:hypothetical protein